MKKDKTKWVNFIDDVVNFGKSADEILEEGAVDGLAIFTVLYPCARFDKN